MVDESAATLPLGCESITKLLLEPEEPTRWLVDQV
jgi:hypothetical protein